MADIQFRCVGASNHTDVERAKDDYYATDPRSIDYLLSGGAKLSHNLWECACGEGHLSKKLEALGYDVTSTDITYRGYGIGGVDFLKQEKVFEGDIITNPPFNKGLEFVEHALLLVNEGNKVFMFLKLCFLEGQKRRKLFDSGQLKTVYVSSKRMSCATNGEFGKYKSSSAIAYAWFEFEKGFKGDPIIKWIN